MGNAIFEEERLRAYSQILADGCLRLVKAQSRECPKTTPNQEVMGQAEKGIKNLDISEHQSKL